MKRLYLTDSLGSYTNGKYYVKTVVYKCNSRIFSLGEEGPMDNFFLRGMFDAYFQNVNLINKR